jgi:hypothetical protein
LFFSDRSSHSCSLTFGITYHREWNSYNAQYLDRLDRSYIASHDSVPLVKIAVMLYLVYLSVYSSYVCLSVCLPINIQYYIAGYFWRDTNGRFGCAGYTINFGGYNTLAYDTQNFIF